VRLRLWQRLFLILAALLLLALGGFVLVQQRAFRAGLLDYVNAIDLREAETIAARLGDEYAAASGWGLLRERPQRFLRLLAAEGEGPPMRPPPREGPPFRPGGGPPARPPAATGEPPPRPPPRGGAALRPRLQLVDAAGRLVAGNPDVPADAPAVPVVVDGRTVGTLRVAPLPRLEDDRDLAFQREQSRAALGLALALLAGALLASLAAARVVTRPLRRLSATVARLADGDLSARSAADGGGEVGELAADFNRMAAALERQQGLQRQWMAELSHELRTPLAVLQGELAALQDGVRPLDRAAVDSLAAEAARLGRLVDDIYDLSLAEAGGLRYRFEPTDLAALLREAVEAQRAACAAAGLVLEAELPAVPCIARADPARLRQAIDNLLLNARRYTDAPGPVRVVLRAERDGWLLSVDDGPPGVPDAALPRLFEPLYRVEGSRARHAGGAGLGLAIVARVLEAHGGRAEAAHSSLGGLRVLLRLPRGTR
jgi:two-component system sensor histidine kinase BaeS